MSVVPFHKAFHAIGSGWTISSMNPVLDGDGFGATTFQSVGSGWTISSLSLTTWGPYSGTRIVQVDEHLDMLDQVVLFGDAENVGQGDSASVVGHITVSDNLYMLDDYTTDSSHPVENALDAMNAGDGVFIQALLPKSEPLTTGDSSSIVAHTIQTDNLGTGDSADIAYNIRLRIGVKVEISHQLTEKIGTSVVIQQLALNPITDYSSPDNPFQVTIAFGEDYLIQNSETDVEVTSADLVTVSITDTGLLGSYVCKLKDVNINLSLAGGGDFFLTTTEPVGTGSQTISVFGLPGVISATGSTTSNEGTFYLTEGTFSSLDLQKPMQLLAQTGPLSGLTANQTLNVPTAAVWSTAATIAQYCAAQANINLGWMANDAPVTDLQSLSSGTVEGTIQAMASRVGADLYWLGTGGYIVMYPDRTIGTFPIPDCRLILASGAKQMDNYMLRPYAAMVFPTEQPPSAVNQGGLTSSITDPIKPPRIEGCGSLGEVLTADSPAHLYPMDPDWAVPYVQCITKTDGTGTYVTTDQTGNTWSQWGGQIIQKKDKTWWISVTSADLPTGNADVGAGNFSMNFGFQRQTPLNAEFQQARNESLARQKAVLEQEQSALRYFQSRAGSIGVIFHGSIPMPGQLVSAAPDSISGIIYTGRINSINLSAPAMININYDKFQKLNLIKPRGTMNAATGAQ